MHRWGWVLGVVVGLGGCANLIKTSATAPAAAVQASTRSAADRERDAREKPVDLLAFADFKRGDVIADVFGGGGYWSELLSGVVGPEGRVLLVNNPPYDAFGREGWSMRLADGRLPNVTHVVGPTTALGLEPASLDGAVMVMGYHDLYWVDESEGWPAVDVAQFMGQVVAAMKPGAILLVVDHAAVEGSGARAAGTLHRIDEAFAIADWRRAGLEWTGSMPALRNPQDDRTLNVFDPTIRGRTDRFVHRYRKPR